MSKKQEKLTLQAVFFVIEVIAIKNLFCGEVVYGLYLQYKQTALTKTERLRVYSLGVYNKHNDKEQWIRITEGCPNNCPFCYEPQEIRVFEIPEIIRNDVKVMDMNLLCKPEALSIIEELGSKKVNNKVVYYSLICGIDWRFLTQDLANALHKNRFKKIRFAWDYGFEHQYKIKDAVTVLRKAGYKGKLDLMIFMVCNWETPYETCLKKLDLLKIWNCQVSDCWYDNQVSPNIKPIHWATEHIKDFRRRCRKHNQMVSFRIDPELRNTNNTLKED